MTESLFTLTHARKSDPETSRKGARRAAPHVGSIKSRILAAMKGREPMNFHEIAKAAGIPEPAVWRRVSELSREGAIKCVGERDDCRTWVLN